MQYKFDKPVHGTIGIKKYQCTIEWRNGKFITDEAVSSGGKDTGPDPHTLFLSSVASCALVTMRMYIDHKGWYIPEIAVNVNLYQEMKDENITTTIYREILFINPVEEAQKERLIEIVKHCPISKILENNIKVRTFFSKENETKKKIKYPTVKSLLSKNRNFISIQEDAGLSCLKYLIIKEKN